MEKIFFYINSTGYLFKSDFNKNKKIRIFLKSLYLLIFGWIHNKTGNKSINFNGLRIYGLTYQTVVGLFFEIFLKNEYKFTSNKKNPTILDLGANIGMASIYFKRLYPDCEIHAFEPDKIHFNILKKNIIFNKFKKIFIYEKAITNYNGEITFYTDDVASFNMSTKKGRMSKIETKVTSISLSSFIKNKNIDILKMDIEGGEFDVLKDIESSGKIDQINEMIIEYHHNIPEDTMKFGNFLKIIENNGFTYQLNTYVFPLDAKNKFQDILIHAYRKNV